MEKAPTMSFFWLKVTAIAFTFKKLRIYEDIIRNLVIIVS